MIGLLAYKIWMIELSYADRLAPVILRAIQNGTYDSFVKHNRLEAEKMIAGFYSGLETEKIREDVNEPLYYTAKAKNGEKVAIIPMMGAITKNGDSCSWGWRDYQNTLSRLEKNPNIAAVVFHYNNTPGGTHDGTPEFAYNIKKMKKANVGFADGYAASAHYYAIAQSDHIMVNKLTPTELGSIGAYQVYQNIQNQIDKGEYPDTKIIRAPQSTHKVQLNFLEPLTEDLEKEVQEDLRGIVKTFIADVKSGRAGRIKTDDVFTGKMYSTEESLKNGLADSKGTLQDAINLAAVLAVGGIKNNRTLETSQSPSNTEMKFPKLSTLFSGEAWNKLLSVFADDQASLEASEKTVADAAIDSQKLREENETHAKKIAELTASVSELTVQVNTLSNEKNTLTAEKAELQTKLDTKPAAPATTVVADGDTDPTKGKAKNSWEKKAEAKVGIKI